MQTYKWVTDYFIFRNFQLNNRALLHHGRLPYLSLHNRSNHRSKPFWWGNIRLTILILQIHQDLPLRIFQAGSLYYHVSDNTCCRIH
jgi:hypothetical protein